MALLCVSPTIATAISIIVASTLWGFHFYVSRPVPPPPGAAVDLVQLEQTVADMRKQLDSLKTAVNMRQLR
mgnify:FL=1